MEFKALKKFNDSQKEIATEYIKGALKYPLRFYNILLLTGMPSNEAQILLLNIKNGFRRSANAQIRRQLLKILDNLINICTSDGTLYARLRMMAMNGQLGGLTEEVKSYLNLRGINNKRQITNEVRQELNQLLKLQEEIAASTAQGVAGTGLGTAFSKTGWGYDPKLAFVRRGKQRRKL